MAIILTAFLSSFAVMASKSLNVGRFENTFIKAFEEGKKGGERKRCEYH